MLGFQRELLNRTLTAAAIAKADGFEHTAAAMLAVAEDMCNEIAARSAREGVLTALQTDSKNYGVDLWAH